MPKKKYTIDRRRFLQLSAAAAAGIVIAPSCAVRLENIPLPVKRKFGKIDFDVTTLGLGGQASIQWTPDGVDPVQIILKAFQAGVNYFDTSNLYALSQTHYGEAFRELNLVPGRPLYMKDLRESIFLTSKSHIRWGKTPPENGPKEVRNWSQGEHGEGVIGDLKRTLTQIFGDKNGELDADAYIDMVLIHSLNNLEEVDVLYKGLETPLDPDGDFGALVALRDYRDGTNHTGLNPDKETRIRHIGFSGHRSSPVMMEMIQRDQYDILDAMLVAINPNDRQQLNMQYNVIPVAKEKGLGIIAMKVFADGAMYTKPADWSRAPEDVVLTVGSEELPSKALVEYALTIPGVHTAIIGIGHIDEDPLKCQLIQNYMSAQIEPDALSEDDRRQIEEKTKHVKDGQTNYFQLGKEDLSAPQNIRIRNGVLKWDTAIAGDEPIVKYKILSGSKIIGEVTHSPQISKEPFMFDVGEAENISVVAVDRAGRENS